MDMVTLLVKANADLTSPDEDGKTPVDVARTFHQREVADYLTAHDKTGQLNLDPLGGAPKTEPPKTEASKADPMKIDPSDVDPLK